MIIFIRKVRQELMAGNRIRKYLFYAIAEIFLVVIGILIALKINTWNDGRKQQEIISSIYAIVKNDLETDINIFKDIVALSDSKNEIFQKIIARQMTREDYNTCNNCVHLLAGFPDVEIEKRGYNLMLDNSTIFNPQADSLYIKINQFYRDFDTKISVNQQEMYANHNDNWFYWKNNMPWFSAYFSGETNEEMIDYMLNTTDYVNRVTATHFLVYQKLNNQLVAYQKQASEIVAEIESRSE